MDLRIKKAGITPCSLIHRSKYIGSQYIYFLPKNNMNNLNPIIPLSKMVTKKAERELDVGYFRYRGRDYSIHTDGSIFRFDKSKNDYIACDISELTRTILFRALEANPFTTILAIRGLSEVKHINDILI